MSRPFGITPLLQAVLAGGLLVFALVPVAAAHDGEPRLIVEPSRVGPGGVVTIRGEDVGADDEVRVVLVGQASRADLTTVTSDGEGHFSITVQVAPDAAAGAYAIEAVASSGQRLAAALSIDGTPVLEEGGGPVGQDEGLPALGPSPGTAAAAAPSAGPGLGSAPAAAVRSVSTPADGSASDVDIVPFLALGGAVGAIGLLYWRTRRSRDRARLAEPS